MINILLIDDEIIFKDSLQYMLFQEFNQLTITSLESHADKRLYQEVQDTHMVFLDLGIKHERVVDVLKYFHERKIRTVLFVSCIHKQRQQLLEALTCKVDGIILKNMEPSLMKESIKMLLNGQQYMPQSVAFLLHEKYVHLNQPAAPNKPLYLLSDREWEVLDYLSEGMSNREISSALFLSENTVKNHVSTLLKKLGVKDRTSAVITAYQQGWTLIKKA